LAKVLWDWRLQSPYPTDEDWVFAIPHSSGKLPYWPGSLYKAQLEPAAKEVGIVGHFGWHTFRHYAESRNIPIDFVRAGEGPTNPWRTDCVLRHSFGIFRVVLQAVQETEQFIVRSIRSTFALERCGLC
jgi:hypothetical protein